jgi:uncharacterized protein involved in copper resistance
VGVEWYELIDDTARLAEIAGEVASETRGVVGIRLSF